MISSIPCTASLNTRRAHSAFRRCWSGGRHASHLRPAGLRHGCPHAGNQASWTLSHPPAQLCTNEAHGYLTYFQCNSVPKWCSWMPFRVTIYSSFAGQRLPVRRGLTQTTTFTKRHHAVFSSRKLDFRMPAYSSHLHLDFGAAPLQLSFQLLQAPTAQIRARRAAVHVLSVCWRPHRRCA